MIESEHGVGGDTMISYTKPKKLYKGQVLWIEVVPIGTITQGSSYVMCINRGVVKNAYPPFTRSDPFDIIGVTLVAGDNTCLHVERRRLFEREEA
jgi:hypothetical protein